MALGHDQSSAHDEKSWTELYPQTECQLLRMNQTVGEEMLIDFNSKWFQTYCRAVLEGDPEIAQIYIDEALSAISQAGAGQVSDAERQAMQAASRYLSLIKSVELPKAG